MASSSSSKLLRWISRKAASLLRGVIVDPAANYSPNYPLLRGVKMINGAGAPRTMSSNVVSGISSSPLLMLPFEKINNTSTDFKFYSLAEKKVVNLISTSKRVNQDRIELVSSSHGWLTLFNMCNCDLFLFNPISGRHITLPPIHTLPIPEERLKFPLGIVTKVITSCSPEQEDCRVLMSYCEHERLAFCSPTSSAEHRRLAFCSPTSSADWTPIDGAPPIPRPYQDFVYSSRQKVFYCITEDNYFEAWNLQDTGAPKVDEIDPSKDQENYPWPARSQEVMKRKRLCKSVISLVVGDDSGDIFWVTRHVMPCMAPDESYVDPDLEHHEEHDQNFIFFRSLPYKTIGFDVHKYDQEKCALVYMDGSLDGLALFIGNNHSFAISPAKSYFPELQPNSIYFTDLNDFIPPEYQNRFFGGHDLGIFDYEKQSMLPCYYPCDRQSITRIIPAPTWFIPTSTI